MKTRVNGQWCCHYQVEIRKPIIATNVGGIPELITNNKTGTNWQDSNSSPISIITCKTTNEGSYEQFMIQKLHVPESKIARFLSGMCSIKSRRTNKKY